MADVAQTSTLRHMAFGLSGWQSLSGLLLGLGLSLGLPNAGACPPGNSPLFNPLSPEQMLPLELLLERALYKDLVSLVWNQ
ncbi:hypothetical protein DVH24_035705 [Malus domestica]|uniref:Uncharacterized protein n=1 Tax=Malus domestica TaxID=3750 RepID=A0A498JQ48_MALDO|nr:hypothetical protein DVH24_035705 [Malus domestica]